ncbi:MAG: hypothetical protein FWC96_05745 [Oscillospiraceae bacterium]|nr:hypothetical protein [Oscillospiraceae bacterium]
MRNEKIVKAYDSIHAGDEIKRRVFEKAMRKQPKKYLSVRTFAATAAVLVLAVLGYTLLTPQSGNSFFVRAYALIEQADGTIGLHEVDVIDRSRVKEQISIWQISEHDDERFFISVGLRHGGKNIESVEFSVDEGFFATQLISDFNKEAFSSFNNKTFRVAGSIHTGSHNPLFCTDFVVVGNTITSEQLYDDLLLFWGTYHNGLQNILDYIVIRATATFYNGETETLMVTIDNSRLARALGMSLDELMEYERQRSAYLSAYLLEHHDHYMSIPLEYLELVGEGISHFTYDPVYNALYWPGVGLVQKELLEFDENGLARHSFVYSGEPDSNESMWTGVIWGVSAVVIERDANGELTGRLYRVPDELRASSAP